MAARKRSAIKPGGMPEAWREKIQATVLIKHLMDHIESRKELSKTQVTAAVALLKKVAPDLQSVAVGQDPNLEPLKIGWE